MANRGPTSGDADPPQRGSGRRRGQVRFGRRLNRFRVPPSRDADGRSLPSDRHVQRVTVRLLCQAAAHGDRDRVLADFFIYSWFDEFDSSEVNEQLPNSGVVDRSFVADAEGEHQRYLLRCQYDACTATPSVRADTIDSWLAEAYVKGVYDKVVYRYV